MRGLGVLGSGLHVVSIVGNSEIQGAEFVVWSWGALRGVVGCHGGVMIKNRIVGGLVIFSVRYNRCRIWLSWFRRGTCGRTLRGWRLKGREP